MEYGNLVKRSWQLTWQYRFLWVLGLFAPSSVGSCSGSGNSGNFNPGSNMPTQLPPEATRAFNQVGLWVSQHLALVFLAIGLVLLLGLVFLVVSLIAQGGIAWASAELALGQSITLGQAWRVGLGLFWRFLGLWLAALGVSLAVALVIGLLALIGYLLVQASGGALGPLFIVLGVVLGLALALAAIPFFIGLSITVTLAQRAIALEDLGPVAALRRGLRLLLGSFGTTLLVWLLSLALSIGAGLVMLVGVLVVLIPLAAIGAGLFFALGLSPGLIAYAAAAILALVVCAWLLSAVSNTYFWNYWSLAYLRLTGRLESVTAE